MRLTTWLAAAIAAALVACAPAAAQKIDALPAATTLGGSEQLRGIQGSGCLTHTTPCTDVRVSATQIATLASAALDAKLVAIAGLSPSANSCFYFTSSTAVASYSCSSTGRTLAGSADAAAARTTLGLGTLATQSGTFSGTSSGTNTGDQTTISGNAGTATKWATARTVAMTGDVAWTSPSLDGSANVTAAGTLATVNSNVGSFGGSTSIPSFTVNGKGLITAAAATTLTAATLASSTVPCKSGVSTSVTGTTTETTLATCTIPANAIGPNGQVEIQTLWSATNSANTKTFRVKFGGTAYYAAGLSTVTSLAAITRITNRNSASSQVGMASNTTAGFGQNNGAGVTTSAVDTTAAVTIDFTAQLTNTGETIAFESYLVRVTYGA
ncbi:hypothetical protein BH10PSE14_BH10PSE14_04270 [soil metagenome]